MINLKELKLSFIRHILNDYFEKSDRNYKSQSLKSICKITTGKLNVNAGSRNGKYPFYTCSKEISRIDRYAYMGNDITIAGNGNIGTLHVTHGKFNAYQRTYILYDLKVNVYYLYYILTLLLLPEIRNFIKGSVIKYITIKALNNVIIPVPPIIEQRKIIFNIRKCFLLADMIQKERDLHQKFAHDMKQSLLLEAMTGHLTQQLPSDGTADDLLQKIRQKKQQLIQAGKIRKHKKLPPINKDEIPFKIPKNWKWVRLGSVGSWKSGSTPKRSNPNNYNGNIPWLKTGDLNNGIINHTTEHISHSALMRSSLRLNPKGSILIAMYGVGTIGKLGILNIKATTNQACCACIPYLINNKFIFYYMRLMKVRFNEMRVGVGSHQNISRTKIINYPFPLSPLPEQHRIVSKLHNLFNTINA